MNVLLFPFGSHGDVHPFIGLGLALRARGHSVTVFSNGHFRSLVERCGLPFVEQGTEEEYLRATEHPDLWHPRRSFAHILRSGIFRAMRPQFEAIAAAASSKPVVVGNCLGFGVRAARDKFNLPLVTVHLQPSVLWSDRAPPTIPGMFGPRWCKSLLYHIAERFIVDPLALPELNRFRAEVGLPPTRWVMRWWHSPDLVLGLFPDWYAPQQPDWPPNVTLTHFPLWDESDVTPVADDVRRFLDDGDAPIVFTPGSGNQQGADFFAAAAEACARLKRRGMLLTRFAAQIPATLPDGVRHFAYVPFGKLLPRAAALVHHGGIGTTAQGLRAGVPQLIMPLAHDQPDNAARVRRLGVGDALVPSRFRGPAVAEALRKLIESDAVRRSCRDVAGRFGEGEPLRAACEAIEGVGARQSDGRANHLG